MIKKTSPIRFVVVTFTTAVLTQTGLRAANCAVDGGTYYQSIDGFGFSSAWCGTLSDKKNAALYDTLGFSLLRIRIDDNSNWAAEAANSAAAHAYGAKVLGCAWNVRSSWLETNNGVMTLAQSHYNDYAVWLNQAADYHHLDYVSIKNEPDGSGTAWFRWSADEMRKFCIANAPTIGRPVAMADAIGFSDSLSDPTLNDVDAAKNISIVSGHFYGNGNRVHTSALSHDKHVWMTEHYIADSRDSIANSLVQAKEIQDSLNNKFSAYFYWWVNDGDASVNLVDKSGAIYKAGYVGGQFAKWIRPGKSRIDATYNPNANVYVTAYRGDTAPANVTPESLVTYKFHIETVGNYRFLFRIFGGAGGHDSFFWRIDSGDWVPEGGRGGTGAWYSTDNAQVDSLSTGDHVLQIAYRGSGTGLDKFVIQLDRLTAPAGNGPSQSASIGVPTGLTVGAGNAQVGLTWNGVVGAANYRIARATSGGGAYSQLGITGATGYIDAGTANGTTYYYTVTALNGMSESLATSPMSARPSAPIAGPETQPALAVARGNTNFTVKSSVVGHTYQLQYRDDLVSGAWLNYGSPVMGTGGDVAVPTPVNGSVPRRFFRLVITP